MKTNQRTLGEITAQLHVLDKRGTTDALEIGALLIEAKERLAALAELYDLADRWRIRGKTATAIIAKCQNKRISNTEESE
jgi:hypothetical protein